MCGKGSRRGPGRTAADGGTRARRRSAASPCPLRAGRPERRRRAGAGERGRTARRRVTVATPRACARHGRPSTGGMRRSSRERVDSPEARRCDRSRQGHSPEGRRPVMRRGSVHVWPGPRLGASRGRRPDQAAARSARWSAVLRGLPPFEGHGLARHFPRRTGRSCSLRQTAGASPEPSSVPGAASDATGGELTFAARAEPKRASSETDIGIASGRVTGFMRRRALRFVSGSSRTGSVGKPAKLRAASVAPTLRRRRLAVGAQPKAAPARVAPRGAAASPPHRRVP